MTAEFSTVRQLLLQHAYLPLVSVQLSRAADVQFQHSCGNNQLSALSVLKPYGNNVTHGMAGQQFRVTGTLLITRGYASFPVRFEPPLLELLMTQNLAEDKLAPLFSISSLEHLMRRYSEQPGHSKDLYAHFFRKIVTSNRVVPFDTLNHPVAQLFVVDLAADDVAAVRRMIVEFRNSAFPKYVQNLDIFVHAFVICGAHVNESDLQTYQAQLRNELALTSTIVRIAVGQDESRVLMPELENATVEQEMQHLSLQTAHPGPENGLSVPKLLDLTLRTAVFEFILRSLVPHMERRLRTWDDAVLAPKKSLTGRFFSVSRKLFNSSDSAPQATTSGAYSHNAGFYHRSAPEQTLRKLADWALMLKDFKYAYSTYDLIKKDYANDKAWAYVAAAQEMCIVSLLLAQTQPLLADTPPQKPDKNTLRKIRHDIIEPYVDNLAYTYRLRLNAKTYAVRSHVVIAELLSNMSALFNIPWWWSDLVETYFMSAEHELATHLAAAGKALQATRAVLYERLAFVKKNSFFVPADRKDIIDDIYDRGVVPEKGAPAEEGYYVNEAKLHPCNDNAVKGLTRVRKSSFWCLMAMREWMLLENKAQIRLLLGSLGTMYQTTSGNDWLAREDLALAQIKSYVE